MFLRRGDRDVFTLQPLPFSLGPSRLFGLQQNEITEGQHIHFGAHEAAVSVLGRTNDRLAADVERGVYDYRISSLLPEFIDDVVKHRMIFLTHSLDARGIIDVCNSRNIAAQLPYYRQ